ncbi:hypothetical protein [Kribbella solani]|uniref:hypothetical protein n=1 Tax=Kribbella solani TaxID=236067 RepID=UPI0029BE6413|nr:hypothetical protein [Kribbella solani]MDX2972167.1 hypothetical protein [Kribbella solani]
MSATVAALVPPVRPAASLVPSVVVASPRGPLPLATLGMRRTSDLVYGLSSIDNRGRVVDSKVMRQLDWPPGLPLAFSHADGRLTVTPDTSPGAGRLRVTTQGHLRIPAPLRHLCALVAGDRVLLAADTARSLVTVFPPATLDRLLSGGESE